MIEITGEVDYVPEREQQIMAPGLIRPNHRTIPVLRLRIRTASGNLMQILHKGDYPGDVTIGHEVVIKGIEKGGVIHAKSIFNKTTNSWVTKKPRAFDCFIATAVYGSPMVEEVILLKNYRDNYLLNKKIGRNLVNFYYLISPSIASKIKDNNFFKTSIRIFILLPIIKLIKIFTNAPRNKEIFR